MDDSKSNYIEDLYTGITNLLDRHIKNKKAYFDQFPLEEKSFQKSIQSFSSKLSNITSDALGISLNQIKDSSTYENMSDMLANSFSNFITANQKYQNITKAVIDNQNDLKSLQNLTPLQEDAYTNATNALAEMNQVKDRAVISLTVSFAIKNGHPLSKEELNFCALKANLSGLSTEDENTNIAFALISTNHKKEIPEPAGNSFIEYE